MKRQKVTVQQVIPGPEHFHLQGSFGDFVGISVDETSGLFAATGSFGTFSHYWTAPGPEGLKIFLGRIQYDYAMNKLRANAGFVFDAEKSIRSLRKIIRKCYLGNFPSPDKEHRQQIAEEIEHLKMLDCTRDEEFHREVGDCSGICDVLGTDWFLQVPCERKRDRNCTAFWNDLFIPFVASYMPDHQCKRVPYR